MAIEPAIDIVRQAGIHNIRAKSISLGDFFIQAYDALLHEKGYELGSPRDGQIRGSHISLRHAESFRIYQALTSELRLIPDFREPDNIRLGFSPLYTSFNVSMRLFYAFHPLWPKPFSKSMTTCA